MNRFILSFLLLFFAFHVKAQNIEQLRDSMAAGKFSFFAYYINRKVLYLQTKWQKKNLWQNVEK